MGGAKPKIVVTHEGKEWIAKLNRKTDTLDVVKIEFATRELAVSVGYRWNGKACLPYPRFYTFGKRAGHWLLPWGK